MIFSLFKLQVSNSRATTVQAVTSFSIVRFYWETETISPFRTKRRTKKLCRFSICGPRHREFESQSLCWRILFLGLNVHDRSILVFVLFQTAIFTFIRQDIFIRHSFQRQTISSSSYWDWKITMHLCICTMYLRIRIFTFFVLNFFYSTTVCGTRYAKMKTFYGFDECLGVSIFSYKYKTALSVLYTIHCTIFMHKIYIFATQQKVRVDDMTSLKTKHS